MNSKQQTVRLSDGHFIPVLGFGTYVPQGVRATEGAQGSKKKRVLGLAKWD